MDEVSYLVCPSIRFRPSVNTCGVRELQIIVSALREKYLGVGTDYGTVDLRSASRAAVGWSRFGESCSSTQCQTCVNCPLSIVPTTIKNVHGLASSQSGECFQNL
jgi:hypothetical protein